MLSKKKIKMIMLSLSMLGLSYISINNDYMSEKDYDVTLIDKFETVGYRGGTNFHGIFKLNNGTVFSDNLNEVDYRMLETNKTYIRTIRPFDIKQSASQNIVYFFGTVIVLSLTVIIVIYTLGFFII
jgi:hypothetical protein